MATYYVNSGAGGANTGGSWTDAYLTFAQGVSAATANGDVVKVHKTHQETLGASATYTATANVSYICVDKDASDAPAEMGAAYWIGHTATHYSITFAGAFRIYAYGLTFRVAGGGAASLGLSQTAGSHRVYENCLLWFDNGSVLSQSRGLICGVGDGQQFTQLKNCTIRFNATANNPIKVGGYLSIDGGSLSASGGAPPSLFSEPVGDSAGTVINVVGFDASHLGSGTLVGNNTITTTRAVFAQCKLGSAYTALAPAIATQTRANRSSVEVYIFDCSSGDTHGLFGYFNAMGSVVSDTGIYVTAGAAAQSWKIDTTANCSYYTPFETPWFGYYNTTTTAISPYVEILRDGSATAYQDDEVWLDVMAKTTSGSTQSSLTTDRMTLLGTPANHAAGAGLGSWTGESGTAWSGKMVMASLTPAEVGHIQARIVVGEPSITVYADPQIRT